MSAVKDFFKTVKFLHLRLLFYYNFLTVFIVSVGVLKCINFNSDLNIYGTVVFSDRDCYKVLKLWRLDNMISEFWAYFHCACAQTAIWERLGPDLQRIVSATYELLMISGTYDKLTTTAEVSLENFTL